MFMKPGVESAFSKERNPAMDKYWLAYLLIFVSSSLEAQSEIPIESWRTHFSYRDARSIALTETGAFCSGSNTLFFLDLQDHSLNKISKIDGLSDSQPSVVAYHAQMKKLVIAYQNGNIDVLSDNQITNVSAIVKAPIPGSKSFNHISFLDDNAYLSADFGVVLLDLIKNEVTESYTKIGASGETIGINFSTIFRDTLFLASTQGVLSGPLNSSVNLQDFRNWQRYQASDGIPNLPASTVSSTSDQLLATVGIEGLYYYQGAIWNRLDFNLEQPVTHASAGSSNFLLTTPDLLLSLNSNLQISSLQHPTYPKPRSSFQNQSGLWVADGVNGLIITESGQPTSSFPSGPFSDSTARLFSQGNTLLSIPPGYDQSLNPLRTKLGFYVFQDGEWQSYNSTKYSNTEHFPDITDLVDVTYSSQNKKYYFASFGEGIVEWDLGGEVVIFDESSPGSTLENIIASGRNVFVSSVYADGSGNVWATNYGNVKPIHRFDPSNNVWEAYTTSILAGRYPLDLRMANNNDLWLRLDPNNGGGLMVFNPMSSSQKHLTDINGSGGLPSRNVKDFIIDRNDQVWVGTNKGLVQYPFPNDILENPVVNASPILIEGRPLFQDETINCITIDGGNRKWIGTENGIWLVSAQGDSVIYHFTAENSPLPSDKILDAEVNDYTGEVFIVTDIGTVSFRGTATEGAREHHQVSIFPNPVTGDFTGLVGISGLVNNATIKITDVTGKLVNELKSSGGTATWDTRDIQGRRVKSGVYLVFSSSVDGNETFIGKIAVIN